jgi:DNA-binding transcriptional ArsR family regulator
MALMSGLALSGTELAAEAGVTLSTASGHLSKLESAGLVAASKQGRTRYFRSPIPTSRPRSRP